MLFKTTADFKKYVPVNVNFTLDQLTPFIRTVERDFVSQDGCLGSAQYDALNTYFNADNPSPDANLDALLPFAQEVAACFAFVKWIPTGQLSIDDVGIGINVNQDRKTAFQWQIDQLTREWLSNGYSALEALLRFLKTNEANYATWKGSNAYTVYKEFLFTGAEDFQLFFNIKSSRRTYAALSATMRLVETLYITPTIGSAYLNELKSKFHYAGNVVESQLNDDDKKILTDLKAAIVHLTIHHATKTLPVDVQGDGIVINSFLAVFDNSIQREPAKMEYLKRLEWEEEVLGRTLIEKFRDYLNKNASADHFPTYFNSGMWDDPNSDEPNGWVNAEDKGLHVL